MRLQPHLREHYIKAWVGDYEYLWPQSGTSLIPRPQSGTHASRCCSSPAPYAYSSKPPRCIQGRLLLGVSQSRE